MNLVVYIYIDSYTYQSMNMMKITFCILYIHMLIMYKVKESIECEWIRSTQKSQSKLIFMKLFAFFGMSNPVDDK